MNIYENLRKKYKPDNVKILFVGESRPNQGTFFYKENSKLYTHTQKAFNPLLSNNFNLSIFKEMGCWLYDVCPQPVNNLKPPARRKEIKKHILGLRETVVSFNPEYIIVVKRGDLRNIALPILTEIGYYENPLIYGNLGKHDTFYLPFPSNSHESEYEKQLTEVLKLIDSKSTFQI